MRCNAPRRDRSHARARGHPHFIATLRVLPAESARQTADFRRTGPFRQAAANESPPRSRRSAHTETVAHDPTHSHCLARSPGRSIGIARRAARRCARCGQQRRSHVAGHRRTAQHCAAHGASRRRSLGAAAERARLLHRQAARHAVGDLRHVPQVAVALARTVGHEPRADPQPAPDLPGPGAVPRQVRWAGPPALRPGARRPRRGALVAARAFDRAAR